MSSENLIYFALVVFALMLIGLGLTVLEFRKGQVHQQADAKIDPEMPKR